MILVKKYINAPYKGDYYLHNVYREYYINGCFKKD